MRIMSQTGLTLVEALITLAIATVLGSLLLIIMVNTGGLFYKQSSKLEQGLNINDALVRIGQSIKESSQVATSYPEGVPTYTSGATQLVLKVPSVDGLGNIILSTFDYFIFFLELPTGSGQASLRFKTFPDTQSTRKSTDQIFSTKVEDLLFEYFDSSNPPQQVTPNLASKIRVTLKLKQKSGAGYEQNIATGEVNLRND